MKWNNRSARLPRPRLRLALGLAVFAGVALTTPTPARAHVGPHGHTHGHSHADGEVEGVVAPAVPAASLDLNAVSENEFSIDQIFGQASFGDSPLDARFNPLLELDRPDLRSIDTQFELNQAFALSGPGISDPTSAAINVVYVDEINFCGSFNERIVGCAIIGGNDLIVESSFAQSAFSGELLAHELSHNFGLPHVGGLESNSNLLNPRLNGNTLLTETQASQVLGSSRVLTDFFTGDRFFTINPIAISAVVPEPTGAGLTLFVGLLLTARRTRVSGPRPPSGLSPEPCPG